MNSKTRKADDDLQIETFLDAIWSQKGLAELTLSAYRQDLKTFSAWLKKRKIELKLADQPNIQAYLAHRFEAGTSARSTCTITFDLKTILSSSG